MGHLSDKILAFGSTIRTRTAEETYSMMGSLSNTGRLILM